MKLLPVHSVIWSSFLVLWLSQSEVEMINPDVCQDEDIPFGLLEVEPHGSNAVEQAAVGENFVCRLYPTNVLNCSWSFYTLQEDTQLFVSISTCDEDEMAFRSPNYSSEERVGSRSLILQEQESLVVLQFNVTLHNNWTLYTYVYQMDMIEVLSPPQNISALVEDGDLLVKWSLPHSRVSFKPACFEYELDIGDQEKTKNPLNEQFHKVPNVDPSQTYRVRIRTRAKDECQKNSPWSAWSHTVTVEQSIYKLNTLVIISISLGIPMILLAVLLLVRYQRVSKVLFPPIPRPPPKYISFLEKNDTFNLFHPAPRAEPVEEITEVEDMEETPGKTQAILDGHD